MITNKIKYKGIAGAVSDQDIQDGWLDELTNMRHRDEKLQPVGHPTKLYNLPDREPGQEINYLQIWNHVQDDINNFIGLTDSYELRLIDMELGSSELIKAYSGNVDIVFLKRFMIIIRKTGMDRFLFKNNDYKSFTITREPVFLLTVSGEEAIWNNSDYATTADAILGKYFARLNTISKENKFTGGLMLRAAYKLFDGSYILHTLPYFLSIENHKITLSRHYDKARIEFYAGKAKVTFNAGDYSAMTGNKDVIQSVTLFATKPQTLIEISEDTITDDKLEEWYIEIGDGKFIFLNNKLEVSEDFKNLQDPASWYKVGEYSFSGILDGEVTTEDIDLDGFYQDYATRETMIIDQFSHHSLSSNFAMNYNSRLILADTKQTLALKTIYKHPAGELITKEDGLTWILTKQSGTADLAIKFIIDTENGEKDVWTYQMVNIWSSNPYMFEEEIVFRGIIGYPDKRAKECKIYVLDDGVYKRLISLKLTASKYMNFAYYHTDKFNSWKFTELIGTLLTGGALWNFNMIWLGYYRTGLLKLPVTNPLNTEIPPDNEIIDTNRIQISEVNNPFYYPAENSYQVGTGTILACETNTEPLSTGQYGEYPLIVFTTKGIWTLFQGQGDVLFSSVKPLNGEVAISKDQIISTGTGVTYSTERGLYLIEGRTVTDLTQLLRGLPNLDIQAVNNYILRLNHINLVQLVDSLSLIDAKGYTLGAKTGFDKKNNELYVTNNNYNYSYVFSFESKLWHKTSE